jgi:hypothetical protein
MYRYGMDASDQDRLNGREEGQQRKCLAQGIVAVTTLGINTKMIM